MPWRPGDEPHHDGSSRYCNPGPYRLGSTVTVRVRIPAACGTTRVRLRSVPDAEPRVVDATVTARTPHAVWWSADLLLHNPVTGYRFLLTGGDLGHAWLTGAGLVHHDTTDDADFRISTAAPAPAWLDQTVGYQVFVDRFARSGSLDHLESPDWAIPAEWSDPVDTTPGRRTRQLYRGDLRGIEARLDHLVDLGVTLLYLTPFFPARSAHRYDASRFDRVDPLLGGDDALASLTAAAHRRGIRVIGDLTLNHTGDHHDWFRTALADPSSVERSFYMFTDAGSGGATGVRDDDGPDDGRDDGPGYVAWHEVPSLPKLDHRSEALAGRLHDGDDSVVARYLAPPFELDGWRIDCANTTARFAGVDENRRVARATRATVDAATDGRGWLVAEHCYDPREDLDGEGWHGVMAYQWVSRPLWAWLATRRPMSMMSQLELPDIDGVTTVTAMRHLAADVSWTARLASMTMLDSHDSARFRSAVGGDPRLHLVGLAALFTLPGVPTVFAGSELGAEGDSSDAGRVPFPWHRLADGDGPDDGPAPDPTSTDPTSDGFLAAVRALIHLRRTTPALQTGGLRFLAAGTDSITYAREHLDHTVVVQLRRAGGEPVPSDDGLDGRLDQLPDPSVDRTGETGADGTGETGADGTGETLWATGETVWATGETLWATGDASGPGATILRVPTAPPVPPNPAL